MKTNATGLEGRPAPVRDRSRDGWRNLLVFFVLTRLGPLWRLVQSLPPLERFVNWRIINLAIDYAPFRPNPFSTRTEYSSWASLTDRTYFGRHLQAVPAGKQPDANQLAALFVRPGPGRASHKSTALFAHFAQWFTDGFMRSDFGNRDRQRMTNTSNHEIDLCNLYGLKPAETAILRAPDGGLLKSTMLGGEEYPPLLFGPDGEIAEEFKGLPPLFAGRQIDFRHGQKQYLFAMGTDRGNVTTGYAMINVLFLREHNRIARLLQPKYPGWDDERLFQTTRNIMIVLLLKIVVEDYVNHIAPYHFKLRLVAGRRIDRPWHRPNWVALEFNLLYRWHSLIPNVVYFGDTPAPAKDTQINNELLVRHGLARAFHGASRQRAGEIGLFNTPAFLAKQTEPPTITTARNAGLASYNDYRELCRFPRVTDVGQISSRPEVQQALRECYPGGVNDIELYTGLFAEDPRPNSVLGPLMGRMVGIDALSQALTNPLLSEHLFNDRTFSEEGLRIIAQTRTLDDIVQRNVKDTPPVSFTHAGFERSNSSQPPPAIPLEDIPSAQRSPS